MQLIQHHRKQAVFDYEKPISIEAHGLYRLAQKIEPELLAKFDPLTALPWDAEFHAWTTANAAELLASDFGYCPDKFLRPFLTSKRPKWYP